jgi:EAL domain-containing protein (putative c-di-GMP-specific phosphodiesterase class I)
MNVAGFESLSCAECAGGAGLDFEFTMAFQPIVDIRERKVFAHEALARGANNEPASAVFSRVNEGNRYRFDQACRVKATQLAAQLRMDSFLSINFLPNAVYQPERCIRTTLAAAEQYGFAAERIIFEFTEGEQIRDYQHLRDIVTCYQNRGFLTAIDDFGAGYSGLDLLAEIQTDLVKLDMALIRGIHRERRRQAIVAGVVRICRDLGIRLIAEGVETRQEVEFLQDLGIELFQGYFFARPSFRSLAEVCWQGGAAT